MKKFLLYLTILVLPAISHASVEEELKRLYKCYGLFVREPITSADSIWKQVAAGTKSGTDACMEIFDKAKLGTNGEIVKGSDGQYDYEGMRVLNTFLRFHKSQFEVPDYGSLIDENVRMTRDVVDANEPAYHFLLSLFGTGEKFSNVVTRDFSVRAKRYSTSPDRTRSVLSESLKPFYVGTTLFSPTLTDTGILVGLERDNVDNSLNQSLFDLMYGTYKFTSTNLNQHLGAGALGSQAYLIGNIGKEAFPSGGLNLFRRWGKHAMTDFLCRDLPSLRSGDVISEVVSTSTISFRTGISCMSCHSSMDNLSGVIRNSRTAFSHDNPDDSAKMRVKFVGERLPDMVYADFPSTGSDSSFHRRPPNGRLFYRSYDGSIVKEEAVGLTEMGERMASTNDLYVCAAKRYYRFLTGINVNLADIGNINTPVMSEGEKFQRNRIIQWGLDLKTHQSLRTLIKTIIQSPAFIYPDRGV